MAERFVRLVLAVAMLATLFLPWSWNPFSDSGPRDLTNSLFIFWGSAEGLSIILDGTDVTNAIEWFGFELFLMAVPVLSLFSTCLLICSSKTLKRAYRVSVLVIVPLTWYEGLGMMDPGWRGVGFWGHVISVSVAALIEILLVRERQNSRWKIGRCRG